jgi:acetylornithine deacetylase/succinyl-diaminopimelate desuccinylase-like protein
LGLTDARIDAEGNVIGVRKGSGNGPTLLISAHLDTVFPAGTDVKVKEHDGKLHAPGISDDTRGLSVLLSWLKVLNDNRIQTVGDLMFVGNVGEEELGNLRGMKAIFRDHPDIDGMVGLEPAPDGSVLVLGTASHRYEVTFKGPGGHSYAAFGQVPSAIHGMGRAIAKIADIKTPSFPKTTFTVGTVSGGTSVNTIAPDARMAVDIRSDEMSALLDTEKKVLTAIDEAVAEENKRWNVTTLSASSKLIGDRPGGRTGSDTVIVEAAVRSNAAFGHKTLLTGASTDANVPMSLGIPAIIIGGGGKTGGFHALSEWIDVTDGWKGAQNALVTVLGLVGVQGVSEPLLAKRPPRSK